MFGLSQKGDLNLNSEVGQRCHRAAGVGQTFLSASWGDFPVAPWPDLWSGSFVPLEKGDHRGSSVVKSRPPAADKRGVPLGKGDKGALE